MQKETFRYTIVPLFTNGFLAVGAFVLEPDGFTGNAGFCYVIAVLATAASLVSVGGFFLHDIGPLRTVISLVSQAAALVFVFAGIYRGFGLDLNAPLVDYDVALYFSVVTWTTLGYGDFAPASELRLLAALQAGLGYLFLGLTVALVANLISDRASAQGNNSGQPKKDGQPGNGGQSNDA